ncbi:unnamed protein product [Candidula unifasciata]|uniref:G-protein coupled receptors family 1 profile domain-containing protein n=1 Tax=Candidula unifasciata TaxID=100452 RepID=A0A8S3ZQK8_9EUPU|nr:unnamed protein product [Candidula unifasciata]
MKAAYTYTINDLPYSSGGIPNRNSSNHLSSTTAEGALLFFVAVAGSVGNLTAMVVTLTCPTFRQMSTAFIFHHCLLDAIKSCFCIPFGYSLLQSREIPYCDVIGASYILLMTVSAYNLLGLLVNEEYQCSFAKQPFHKNDDACCIAFGVIIVWFTTVLLHLGVIFLPGKSEFSKDIGNCVYRYGVTKNYVIHVLWVILVSGALFFAILNFLNFFRKLQSGLHSNKWTFLHKSLSSLSRSYIHNDQNEEVHYEFDNRSSQKAIQLSRQYLKRIIIMLCMLVSFIICWYPFFILILTDIKYQQPAHIYRRLMMLAWAHPVTTPIFCAIIYHNTNNGRRLTKDVYSNAIPMTVSRSGDALRQEISQTRVLAFRNDNFQPVINHARTHPSQNPNLSQNVIVTEPSSPELSDATNHIETIINYNVEDGRYQTLIM